MGKFKHLKQGHSASDLDEIVMTLYYDNGERSIFNVEKCNKCYMLDGESYYVLNECYKNIVHIDMNTSAQDKNFYMKCFHDKKLDLYVFCFTYDYDYCFVSHKTMSGHVKKYRNQYTGVGPYRLVDDDSDCNSYNSINDSSSDSDDDSNSNSN